MEDIQDSEVSVQLGEHRISYLRSVLESYGEVEHFSNNIESNNYVLVTYRTHEMADLALRKLRNKNEVENIMRNIKDQLRKNKLPDTVCPQLFRYRYDWSERTNTRAPKNAYSMKKVTYQKNDNKVKKEQQNGANSNKKSGSKKGNNNESLQNGIQKETPTAALAPKKKKKKTKKKSYQKKVDENIEQSSQQQVNGVNNVVPEEKVQIPEVKRSVDAEGLRREADKAKLKDELEYLAAQLENVESEIAAENKRCKDRDIRINKLSEELRRVDLAKDRLERQLSNERRWKKLNQDTVAQLKQELDHIVQEQQSAQMRLNQDTDEQYPFTN